MKSQEENVCAISDYEIETIDSRFDALYECCNKMEPVSSYINVLEVEFNNRDEGAEYFNIDLFKKRLCDVEHTVMNYFNKFGVDRFEASSALYYNRVLYEVYNTTKFEIRYFTCIELANPFIKKCNYNNDIFQLAKVFNAHHQVVHTPYF